jgi:flavin reductase (DIM6/NTAB) family NADH-FMN oxidoreductase RutF
MQHTLKSGRVNDMEKIMIGKTPANAFPAVIVGAMVNGKANFLTLGCYGLVSIAKPTVCIMSAKGHYTNIGIRESGHFSVNIPSAGQVQITDYMGLVSGHEVDKSEVFSLFFGTVDKVPMIRECPANLLCKVVNTDGLPNVPGHEVFYGEVLESYVSEECMSDGQPDIKKINPLMLAGRSYWDIGSPVGTPWYDGAALVKKESPSHG